MPNIHSYVVTYDSGFAPNPFGGFCTLATCKPDIRKHASLNDWIVGTGSDREGVRRGGFLVYAMRITEALPTAEYWANPRFSRKKPNLYGSYRMACGDNIYYPDPNNGGWGQINSYHSNSDGTPEQKHINRDTKVQRVLISDDFVYFGAEGPEIPENLREFGIICSGRGRKKITDQQAVAHLEGWVRELGVSGYQGRPYDMLKEARGR